MLGLCLSSLRIEARHFVAIFEDPFAIALGFVVVEVTSEVATVRVLPLTTDHLTLQELSYVFLARLSKHICSLTIFLTVRPVARVDVPIFVSHDSLSMSFAILPVTVVVANTFVMLFADT